MLSKVLSKLLLPMKIRGTVHRFFFELTPKKSQIFRRDIDPAPRPVPGTSVCKSLIMPRTRNALCMH
jgi:hypothetical protein